MNTHLYQGAIGVLLAGTLHAAPLLEESFDYEPGPISGLDGGTGFAGAWSSTRNNPTVAEPDKTWGTKLVTAGGHARGNAWSGLQRPIGTTLADGGLMANGATLWFSVIMDLEGQNTTNADLNLCLGTDRFAGDFGNRENLLGEGATPAEGIGVTHSRGVIEGVYWQDVDNNGVGERTEYASSLTINGVGDNLSRGLIVGKVEWGADDSAGETLTLYAPDMDLNLGDPIMGPQVTEALDQSQFDTLALQFKDTPVMDEIRFGATAEDVLPVAPDTTVAITAFDAVGGGLWEVALAGAPNADYVFRSSTDLQFDSGVLIENLTQGDPADPGTIGGANDSVLTLDEGGIGMAQLALTGANRDFIRAEPPPPLLSEDFETGLPGTWAASDNGAGTAWSVGTPDGTGTTPDGAANGTQCAGTNMLGNYTHSASASLVSPAFTVPPGGATLNFSQYIDTEAASGGEDFASIRLLNAGDNSPLADGEVIGTIEGISEAWTSESLPLPAAANGLEVKIEFLFESDDDDQNFAGFYIDDVLVTPN